MKLPLYQAGTDYYISTQGLQEVLKKSERAQYPGQHVLWTDDVKIELPIRMGLHGPASLAPMTIVQFWEQTLSKHAKMPALSVKRNSEWMTISFEEYYDECMKFACALLALNIPEWASVNIIGFNKPEWLIAFFGTVFARCIPAGVYSTNSEETCEYIAKHSQAKVVVAENREYAKKYLKLLQKGQICKIVLYDDQVGENSYGGKLVTWEAFLSSGRIVSEKKAQERMDRIRPGHCCLLCYTSGTTGMPKGVMISHDNCTWTARVGQYQEGNKIKQRIRIVSYLPLSHIASFFIDVLSGLLRANHLYFAEPTALQGTLMPTIMEVKPYFFFTVPRVWEKIYLKLRQQTGKAQGLQRKIIDWAQSLGKDGSIKELRGEKTSWQFKLAKKLIFDKIKKALGLDEAVILGYGGGPLDPTIRQYFLSMNFTLINGYGMTETTAPQSKTPLLRFNPTTPEGYMQVGCPIPGGETIIKNKKEGEEEGEICMRGRNVCMGYLGNPQETSRTIDSEGYLHSGDLGRIDRDGFLFLTGRIKQIIITAGGENVPPVLIENNIRKAMPCISNVMVVGDKRPYLTCLISLLEETPQSGVLEKTAKEFLKNKDCEVSTVKEAKSSSSFRAVILEGLKEANTKAISRAQMVHDFYLIPEDFTMANGTLTASLKLKRKEALRLYQNQIDQMYTKSKL